MIGLMLHTHHFDAMPCGDTAGVYVIADDYTAGLFKNSECRVGAWGGWALETNVLSVGSANVKSGIVAGVILGYKANPVFPLLVPSIAVSFDNKTWLRLTYLPKVKTGSSGVTISVEYSF